MMNKNDRDFIGELDSAVFSPITYGIFNRLDEDMAVYRANKAFGETFSIDDFEYFDFPLTDKEKFLMSMRNKEYLKNIKKLQSQFSNADGITVYAFYDEGIVRVVKLKSVNIVK